MILRLLLAACVLVAPSAAVISIENNGYKGITVAIHSNVPDEPELVDHIKELFASGSHFLYEATRHRAYFNEVTIVVPSEWEHRPEYETVRPSNRFATADARVDIPNAQYGDAPYTLQPGECGEEGDYIHLTPDFIRGLATAGSSAYGDPGRALVHEWSHLRYGLFDEHGYQQDSRTPPFYLDDTGQIKYTGCTADVPGWLRDEAGGPCRRGQDGLPDEECLFYPDMEDDSTKASIMAVPFLPSVNSYCDDTEERKHNSLAPSMHNLMCQGRSTWGVLMDHPDFVRSRNPPREFIQTLPVFRVVQPKRNDNPTFVLVLDVSASMRGKRIELLHKAAARFIKYQLADHSSVGMVAFSSEVQVLSNMTTLDKVTRGELAARVPERDDDGFTAIGKGILEGLQLLKVSREPTEGALMLLVTDGEENVDPYVESVLPDIIAAKVVINTIAFGRHASKRLESLVTLTGGRGFFYDDEKVGHKALDTAFLESAATQADVELQPVEVTNRYQVLEKDEEMNSHFVIDKDIGTNTAFLVTYDFPGMVEVVLITPNHKKYDSKSKEFTDDIKTNTISIDLPLAEPGKWNYIIISRANYPQDISVVVTSEARNIREQPIRVRSWVSDVDLTYPAQAKIYAEVKKEYNAIVDASVVATIGRPEGDPIIMMLYDNGAGADTTADDGIYSSYFTHFNGSGRYSVEAVVLNNGRARIKLGSEGSPSPRMRLIPKEQVLGESPQATFMPDLLLQWDGQPSRQPRYAPADEFERSVSAGSFRLQDWKDIDVIPPNRVTDLHVINVDSEERLVTLTWTSPGDDMDQGEVTMIDLRYSTDASNLLHNFSETTSIQHNDIVEGNLLPPPPPRQSHNITVRVPLSVDWNYTRPVLAFALLATDEAGNSGDVSNLAIAYHIEKVLIETEDHNGSYDILFHVLLLLGVALALVIVIALIAVCVRSRKKKKRYECKHKHTLLPSA